jgi:hypothetical protein
MDLRPFIKNLREHDLSLAFNTSNYDRTVIERTEDVHKEGIELFKLKNESVNSFAFD